LGEKCFKNIKDNRIVFKETMQNKKEYILFVNENKDVIPIFFHPEWLDVVCEKWTGLVYKENNNVAIFPIPMEKYYYFFNLIRMPKQTPFLGVWFLKDEKSNYKRNDIEEKIINDLLTHIPKFNFFNIRFSTNFTNHQPFYWKGFQQTTQYTYILEGIKDLNKTFNEFKGNVRTDIRKAEKLVKVEEIEDIELFYKINMKSFERQGIREKYSLSYVKKIDELLKSREQRKILIAKDDNNNIHAVLYLLIDFDRAYYLWGGADPKFRNSAAQILLLWEAIKKSSEFVDIFDFEGSMLPLVAKVFRKFNAIATPYHRIYKKNYNLFK